MASVAWTDPARDDVEEHSFSRLDAEVGGFLVGSVMADGTVAVDAAVPALAAESGQAHLTITHEVWDDVLPRIERDYPGKAIVGWYHTHPGFGLFLSSYDLFIHENFFPQDHHVALVVDPLAGEFGWFGWRDGKVTEVERGSTTRPAAPRVGGLTGASRSWRDPMVLAIGCLTVAAAFAVGWLVGTSIVDQPTSRTPAAPTAVVVQYTVQKGDTWKSVVRRFKDDGVTAAQLKAANPEVERLRNGTTILVPIRLERSAQ